MSFRRQSAALLFVAPPGFTLPRKDKIHYISGEVIYDDSSAKISRLSTSR
jgi:hypothetical protein